MQQRVGWGFDAHRFGGDRPVLLGGVPVDPERRVAATSDGDVLAHAVADAVLGAGALGDLGTFFPSDDPQWEGADSMLLLGRAVQELAASGWAVVSLDVTVIAERVRVAGFREEIRAALAGVLRISVREVSVKATSTDGMGYLGRDEGIAAVAVLTAVPN